MKFLLLFDMFEGINGALGLFYNSAWMEEILQQLTPSRLGALMTRHGIVPAGDEP